MIFKLVHGLQVHIAKVTLSWLSSVKSNNYEGSGHRCMLCFVYLCMCWFCQANLFGAVQVWSSLSILLYSSAYSGSKCRTQVFLPPHQSSQWQKTSDIAWFPIHFCLLDHIAFQKLKSAFIPWLQSWYSQNLSVLFHAGHALLSCWIDPAG